MKASVTTKTIKLSITYIIFTRADTVVMVASFQWVLSKTTWHHGLTLTRSYDHTVRLIWIIYNDYLVC